MYTTPTDIYDVISGTLELTEQQEMALAMAMWRHDLDPKQSEQLAQGLVLIGLNPDDFGIERADS